MRENPRTLTEAGIGPSTLLPLLKEDEPRIRLVALRQMVSPGDVPAAAVRLLLQGAESDELDWLPGSTTCELRGSLRGDRARQTLPHLKSMKPLWFLESELLEAGTDKQRDVIITAIELQQEFSWAFTNPELRAFAAHLPPDHTMRDRLARLVRAFNSGPRLIATNIR